GRLRATPFTRLPVYRESIDNVVGLLHTKDVMKYYLQHGTMPSVEAVMRPMALFSENVTADRLITLMRKRHSRQAVVIDEFGGVAGLITVENILGDVLGRVPGRGPVLHPRAEVLPDGRVRLPGMMRLHEAETWIGVLWEGESDTIGGRVVEALGEVPAAGQVLYLNGIEVEVEAVTDRLVTSI